MVKVPVYIPESVLCSHTEHNAMSVYLRCQRALSRAGIETKKRVFILGKLARPWCEMEKALSRYFEVTVEA